MSERSRRSRPIGLGAEAAVEHYLEAQGFRLLARNHHSQEGEVDLIVSRGELVVFVEVKARGSGALVDALTSVTAAKQRKIVRAALDFISRSDLKDPAIRFDVVAVTADDPPAVIAHIEGAFDASAGDDR